MPKTDKLTKKQLIVIDELFAAEADETAILEKHGVSRSTYNKWLTNEAFKAEFARRIEWHSLQSQALIARYGSLAAAKLVALTESDKPETARKACLDILSLLNPYKKEQIAQNNQPQHAQQHQLTPQQASKLLEAIAKT